MNETGLMTLRVITPERLFFEGNVSMAEFVTTEGALGIYPGHISLTAAAAPGILRIHEENEVREAALMAGFVTVFPDAVTIMAETAEWPEEIDINRAKEARIRAERRLKETAGSQDMMRAELALRRALVRLSLAG